MRVKVSEERARFQCSTVQIERSRRLCSTVAEPQLHVPEVAQSRACKAEIPRVPLHGDDGDSGFGHQFGGRSEISPGFENECRRDGRHNRVRKWAAVLPAR